MTDPDGTYPYIRTHPWGGYAVVRASVHDSDVIDVIPTYHDRFFSFRAAVDAARQEALDGEYAVHPEIYRSSPPGHH